MLVLLCAITNHTIKALTVSQKITVHGNDYLGQKKVQVNLGTYLGPKANIVACSAQIGGYFSLSTTGP